MTPTLFLQHLVNALSLGSLYALIAIGYTMVYGILRLINFAHGDVFMLGAYLAFYSAASFVLPWWATLLLALFVTAAFGIGLERVAYRPLRDSPRISVMISAIGASFLIENVGIVVFGGRPKGVTVPAVMDVKLELGGVSMMSVSVVIPAMLLVADWYPLGRWRRGNVRQVLIEKVPYLVLSAAITIFMLGGLLFFLGGGDLKQIAILTIVALIVVFLVVKVSSTGQNRMENFLMGLQDLTKASDHVMYSFEAIVKGGWFGVGLGLASTKLVGLPFAPTDSIFAVIAEELGLAGVIGTVTLYALLVWRGLRIAQRSPDMLGSLLASGLTLWIAIEAVINMLVMVGLMPFAGNALPFISYGGSNLVSTFLAIGILMSVSRHIQPQTETEEWRNLGASLDLRRRNRRRSVSRISRP